MANSKVELLHAMQGKSVTHGWGALTVFNRTRMNRLLQQQFIAGFNELSFLPALSGKVYLEEDKTVWADLDSIYLTHPLLSFETATLDDSTVTLTFFIASGNYTVSRKSSGEPPILVSTSKISEQQGFTVTLEVPLNMVEGSVKKQGQVTLDLSAGFTFRCSLGSSENSAKLVGNLIKEKFNSLPEHKRVFRLGAVDFNGYGPLTPTKFYIRTQAAPGATLTKASNFGDGGVLVFIRLAGSTTDGYFPSEAENYPYFIPDDVDSGGNDLYSASVILSQEFIKYLRPGQLPLLATLLFPGENVFEESSVDTPFDHIVFGNISPALTSLAISPIFSIIKAGSEQHFTVQSLSNVAPKDISWSVRSLNSIHSAGTVSDGTYKSVLPHFLGKETVRNLVTASYVDPLSGALHGASALVMVTYDGMAVSPLISHSGLGAGNLPIQLSASTLSNKSLTWALLEPKLGTLTANGNTAVYSPPATMPETSAVQKIQVSDISTGESVQASVILLKTRSFLEVTPAYTPAVGRAGQVQLKAYLDILELQDQFTVTPTYRSGTGHAAQVALKAHPGTKVVEDQNPIEYRWWLSSGEGAVDQNGLFTAPVNIVALNPVSVVRCDVAMEGVVYFTGHSVIQLSDLNKEAMWSGLVNFKLTAPAAQTKAYANGYQQIALDVEIETALVGNEAIPITPEELSSLTIVDRSSGQELSYLDVSEEGLEVDDTRRWAVSVRPNLFDAFGLFTPHPHLVEPRAEASISRARVYIVTRDAFPKNFHARFIDSFSVPHNSNLTSNEPPRTIELIPVNVPSLSEAQYSFSVSRVAGGGKSPPDQDAYDYFLRSTDYWLLGYKGDNGLSVKFVSLEMTGLQSTVQWESRRVNEGMFSYTGYFFNDGATPASEFKLIFDDELKEKILLFDPSKGLAEPVAVGDLLISLDRVDDIYYVGGCQTENSLVIKLLDRNGNHHGLSVGFAAMSVEDSRNKLVLRVV